MSGDAVAVARRIGTEVAARFAAEVDREARFPVETIDALRGEGLLGALVPLDDGGLGHDLRAAAGSVRELARYCASSAMILAMHHIQVACLVRHGREDQLRDWTGQVAQKQLLLASATTEIGIGGNTRSSTCFLDRTGEELRLEKTAPVISYGEYADAVLATARHDEDAAPGDQVLVVCPRDSFELDPISGWDTLGFRGTCSRGFRLTAAGPSLLLCSDTFGDISTHTMLPTAHLLWSSLWAGIADEATDRARRFVQQAARRSVGTLPPGTSRLAEALAAKQQLSGAIADLLERYLRIANDADATSAPDFMAAINLLKVTASELVVDVVNRAMLVCGIAGYREDSDFSLGRLLRDAHGAAVMVNNDRILGNTAQLLLVARTV